MIAALTAVPAALLLAGCSTEVVSVDPENGLVDVPVFPVSTDTGLSLECIMIEEGPGNARIGGPFCWTKGSKP
jgi:hypothetical protein